LAIDADLGSGQYRLENNDAGITTSDAVNGDYPPHP
jgi:hypothetical protein